MTGEILILLLIISLLIGLLTGHPITFVFGGLSVIFGLIGWGPSIFTIFIGNIYSVMNSYGLVAIPMFVLMASFLSYSKIAENLFDSLRYLLGRVNGGMAIAVVLACTIFAATTGIVGASVVTMGLISLPLFDKYGYNSSLGTGVVVAGGTLGILIPPSIMLIFLGTEAEVSVGKLFLAALLPGLILSFMYCLYVLIICHIKPEYGPSLTNEEIGEKSLTLVIKELLINLVPAAALIVMVLGAIFKGVATPTEASGVGAFVALILTFIYKKFSFEMLKKSVFETSKISAMILLIVVGAKPFTSVFIALNGDTLIQDFIIGMGMSRLGVLIIFLLLTFIIGMLLDWTAIVLILLPIFLPLTDKVGYNRLYVVALMAVMMQTAFLTPPVGGSLFFIKGVTPDTPWPVIYKGVFPFVIIMLFVVSLLVIFPQIIIGQ